MSTFSVQLAVYDLSHGMARQMSGQFLGPQYAIDIIPHTAIVVYGREYFFGGGIQHEDPNQFRQMRGIHPVQVLSLGHTSVTRDEFHSWCQTCTQTGQYTAASYDLLTRNCNNFSHDAAIGGLKLPEGVPDWILGVPQKFLSSPMGQMIRPMLENMQMSGGSSAPFSNAPTNTFAPAIPAAVAVASVAAPTSINPWANISESTSTNTKEEESKPKSKIIIGTNTTPILDSYCKPLVSSEYKTVALCVKKISASLEEISDQKALQSLGQTLTTTQKLNSQEVEQASHIILTKVLQQASNKSTVITFALMLLRVIVLESTGVEKGVKECLIWIEEQLLAISISNNSSTNNGGLLLASHTARSMAWLTLANAASLSWWTLPESLVEAAFVDWNVDTQPRPEVRQAAAAFCYNNVLLLSSSSSSSSMDDNEFSDDQVSLLCGSLESIAEEPDATTQLRRLLVAARILVPKDLNVMDSARILMRDLGFPDAIQELQTNSTTTTGNTKDATKCKGLAREVLGLLQ